MKKRIIVGGVSLAALALGLSLNAGAEARDRFPGFDMAQAQTISNLNSQRSQIESRIATASAQGQLTSQQASDLRSQLSLNATQQAQSLADNFLTVQETQTLLNSLNGTDTALSSAINTYVAAQAQAQAQAQAPSQAQALAQANLNAATNVSLPGSNAWFNSYGRPANPAFAAWHNRQRQEILNLQSQLASKLEAGRSNGRLSPKEYTSLKAEYDRINTSIQRLAASNGRFSRGEMASIENRLNNLEDRINRDLRDRDFASRYGRRYW